MERTRFPRLSTARAESLLPGAAAARIPAAATADADLEAGRGPGSDFLGWVDLPRRMQGPPLEELLAAAESAREGAELLVVVGIGGSYLGTLAVAEALRDTAHGPGLRFAGTDLGAPGLARLLAELDGREFRICVVSKSGTTLEPAVAFRILRRLLIDRHGRDEAARRIVAVTDARRGALRDMAAAEGWTAFAIPDDVGGRFSVLSPVGLFPLAVAGFDVRGLLEGAAAAREACREADPEENPVLRYAATRHALLESGFTTEVLSTFHGDLGPLQEWWKQLFGESEGKDGRGVFPAACRFTTDLHSLGQYLQDGRRDLFETFLHVRSTGVDLTVPPADGGDGLGYLEGRSLDEINQKAYEGTLAAHVAGGVPVMTLELDALTAPSVGGLLYFFERAVAVSGRLLGVNPFDQPGVEAYKREMFRLLGRP